MLLWTDPWFCAAMNDAAGVMLVWVGVEIESTLLGECPVPVIEGCLVTMEVFAAGRELDVEVWWASKHRSTSKYGS